MSQQAANNSSVNISNSNFWDKQQAIQKSQVITLPSQTSSHAWKVNDDHLTGLNLNTCPCLHLINLH